MTWRTLISTASIAALIAAGEFVTIDRARAAETAAKITTDSNAQFVPLEVGKFFVVDLPRDVRVVMVAKKDIANVVTQTARRIVILGVGTGQTDIAFYDGDQQEIKALNLTVVDYAAAENDAAGPESLVVILRGAEWKTLSCTHTSSFRHGAACYTNQISSASGTLDSVPAGSSVTMPAGGGK